MPGSDLDLLQEAVKEAGAIALRWHRKSPRHWQKPDGTTVTEADIAVDTFLRETITKSRPDDAWLSEETPDNPARLGKSRLWIADPIDGTRLFLAGEENWGIGLALTEHGKPVLSAVYCPSQNKLFHAAFGKGAFLNQNRLAVSANKSHHVIAPKAFQPALATQGLDWTPGSGPPLLLRFTAIAEGTLAGAITLGEKNDWDIAAGQLILEEAGGLARTADNTAMIYNREKPWQPGVVAGVPEHVPALMDCVRKT